MRSTAPSSCNDGLQNAAVEVPQSSFTHPSIENINVISELNRSRSLASWLESIGGSSDLGPRSGILSDHCRRTSCRRSQRNARSLCVPTKPRKLCARRLIWELDGESNLSQSRILRNSMQALRVSQRTFRSAQVKRSFLHCQTGGRAAGKRWDAETHPVGSMMQCFNSLHLRCSNGYQEKK